jgi:hypothetical protein
METKHEVIKEGSNKAVDETDPPLENLRANVRSRILAALMEQSPEIGMRVNVAELLAEDVMKNLFENEHNGMFDIKRYIKQLEEK